MAAQHVSARCLLYFTFHAPFALRSRHVLFLRQLPEHYLLMAPDGTILDASDRYLAATLKERAAIVGRNVFDVFPREEQNDWQVFAAPRARQHATPHTVPRICYDMQRPAEQERPWRSGTGKPPPIPFSTRRGRLSCEKPRT